MTAYEMGDLRSGRTLDIAAQILRTHFKDLLKINLYFFIPACFISTLLVFYLNPENHPIGAMHKILNTLENPELAAPSATQSALQLVAIAINALYGLAAVFFIIPVTAGATIYYIASRYLGRDIDPRTSLKRGFKKYGHILVCGILYWLISLAGGIVVIGLAGAFIAASVGVSPFLAIPGVLFVLGAGTVLFYFWVRYALCFPVVMVEDIHDIAAFRRSSFLTRNRIWRGIALNLLACYIIGGLVVGGAMLVAIPVWLNAALITLATVTTYSYTYAVLTVYYFNCRSLHENFDIAYLARLGLPPEAPEAAPAPQREVEMPPESPTPTSEAVESDPVQEQSATDGLSVEMTPEQPAPGDAADA